MLKENKLRYHRTLFCLEPNDDLTLEQQFQNVILESPHLAKGKCLWCYSKRRLKRENNSLDWLTRGCFPRKKQVTLQSLDDHGLFNSKVLGKTFDIVVFQHFQGLTANIMCQAIDTCRGGGVVLMALPTQVTGLANLKMDVHKRWSIGFPKGTKKNRTDQPSPKPSGEGSRISQSLFNERMSRMLANYNALSPEKVEHSGSCEPRGDFSELVPSEIDSDGSLGRIVSQCASSDQARGLLKLLDQLCSVENGAVNSGKTVFVVLGGRGRGKSAMLGLTLAATLLVEWKSNTPWQAEILVAAIDYPTELFNFLSSTCERICLFKVIDKSSSTEKGFVQISVDDRVCGIRYVSPATLSDQGHSGMLLIDEANAFPVTLMDRILLQDQYSTVILSSTSAGYEGRGAQALFRKTLTKLSQRPTQVELNTPIRYARFDPVERFLQDLTFAHYDRFDAAVDSLDTYPPVDETDLFLVDKRELFSNSVEANQLLSNIVRIMSASHYRYSPNDLQLIGDSREHMLALLCPWTKRQGDRPTICTVIHMASEGSMIETDEEVPDNLWKGGDLIPICLYSQFDDKFWLKAPSLRIVRIATNPKCQGLGYGTRALKLLLSKVCIQQGNERSFTSQGSSILGSLCANNVIAQIGREESLPLFVSVSYGLTDRLLNFWIHAGFVPLYLRPALCGSTGEHTCIMICPVYSDQSQWLLPYFSLFTRRLQFQLRGSLLRQVPVQVCRELLLGIEKPRLAGEDSVTGSSISDAPAALNEASISRLSQYNVDFADHHVILDLIPLLVNFLYANSSSYQYSHLQQSIVIGLGLQGKSLTKVAKELELPISQARALLNRLLRQIVRDCGELSTSGPMGSKRSEAFRNMAEVEFSTQLEQQEGAALSEEPSANRKRIRLVKNANLDDVL